MPHHFGKITNPLALGREIKTANEAKEIVVEKKSDEDCDPQQITVTRPIPPKGFSYGSNGGVFMDRLLDDEDGKGKTRKQIMVLPYDLFAVDILNSNGDHMVHMLAFRPDGVIDVLIPHK